MELEFVRSVNISEEKAPDVMEVAKENNVVLTCHAPYFINLNSNEDEKVKASQQRILNSAKVANLCGAWSVCFHPGFYMKEEPKKVYNTIKENLKYIVEELKEKGNNIWLRPETTGKATQFGDLNELLSLSCEFDNVMPCIDFSHIYARSIGKHNSYQDFYEMLNLVEKKLGKKGLDNMHIHVAGIEYGPKGERNHLKLRESDFNFKELLKVLKDFNVKGVLICESPNIEEDALLMQKTYKEL
jgi:deoxyribonuclease-4